MPEGDAVLRTARSLDRALAGATLVHADLRWPSLATADLTGRTVLGTATYGKHLLTRLDDGTTLHSHLRMDGQWSVRGPGIDPRSAWVRAVLGTARHTAVGNRLGMLDLVATDREDTLVGHLGPDVLAPDFPATGLARATAHLAERPESIAAALLDQRNQAGLGTIWMAESLFTRRIHPWTPAREVPDTASLLMTARELMLRSVDAAESPAHRVHSRARKPCVRCGSLIVEGSTGPEAYERPVFWCPGCQPARTSSPRGDQPPVPRAIDRSSSAGTVSGMDSPSAVATRSLTSRRTIESGTPSASQIEASSSDEASF